MNFLYIIGPPGVGKSTLTRGLIGKADTCDAITWKIPEMHHTTPRGTVVEFGRERDPFRGTDTLAMNAITYAEQIVENEVHPLMLCEGDRLACDRFFDAVSRHYSLTLVHVDAEPEELQARRAGRGTNQDEKWIKGRTTKAERLADKWDAVRITADLDSLLAIDSPVIRTLGAP